jgi:CIC family chloride channel protein
MPRRRPIEPAGAGPGHEPTAAGAGPGHEPTADGAGDGGEPTAAGAGDGGASAAGTARPAAARARTRRAGKRRPEPVAARPRGPITGTGTAAAPPAGAAVWSDAGPLRGLGTWLRGSRLGLVVMALLVGVTSGLGAVGFRWLIVGFTWLATGHGQFGQQGRVGSLHLPWLGTMFLLLIPVLGGLVYGPLIQRFAREARGHGVPEVMLAVAENGGRIRPPVTVVKALASAICIGTGGSVGREGPIVQIGSAFASTLGQVVRMSETKLRIIVACGAAGGIAATFNAPITGMFFGFEIILREFSLDALFATILSAVTADLVSRAFFGAAPFFGAFPHDLAVTHTYTYLLVAVLGVVSGLVGYGFKTVLYKLEDVTDALWRGRPEWARPAVGGVALGALLIALPQLYGVGYPVMNRMVNGHAVLWFLVVLMLGKVLATSLTLSIGGSGGVFAPSLFTGAAAGMAYGVTVDHLFGHVVKDPAAFAVVAMGAVFGAAAQAPLTAIASVAEMTGNFGLILPVMLAVGIAAAVSKRLSYGSIYTTKLLRRGIDIERPTATNVLQQLTVGDVMAPLAGPGGLTAGGLAAEGPAAEVTDLTWAERVGPVVDHRWPQALFADETLDQALRQLVLYGRSGLPVLAPDGAHLEGWLTRQNVLRALSERVRSAGREAERGTLAAEFAVDDAARQLHLPSTPLAGYQMVEIALRPGAPGIGQRLSQLRWPRGVLVAAVTEGREIVPPRPDIVLATGERIILLAPMAGPEPPRTPELQPSGEVRR